MAGSLVFYIRCLESVRAKFQKATGKGAKVFVSLIAAF